MEACAHIFQAGPEKGKRCTKAAWKDGCCGSHNPVKLAEKAKAYAERAKMRKQEKMKLVQGSPPQTPKCDYVIKRGGQKGEVCNKPADSDHKCTHHKSEKIEARKKRAAAAYNPIKVTTVVSSVPVATTVPATGVSTKVVTEPHMSGASIAPVVQAQTNTRCQFIDKRFKNGKGCPREAHMDGMCGKHNEGRRIRKMESKEEKKKEKKVITSEKSNEYKAANTAAPNTTTDSFIDYEIVDGDEPWMITYNRFIDYCNGEDVFKTMNTIEYIDCRLSDIFGIRNHFIDMYRAERITAARFDKLKSILYKFHTELLKHHEKILTSYP